MDDDGLLDGEEVALGTSPFSPDTDVDGLSDIVEVQVTNTDPLLSDTDEDNCLDGIEDRNGDGLVGTCTGEFSEDCAQGETDPLDADSNGDGLLDCDENGIGTCPGLHATEPLLIRSESGDYTVAVPPSSLVFELPTDTGALGHEFDMPDQAVAGLVIRLTASTTNSLQTLAHYLESIGSTIDSAVVVRSPGRQITTHDGAEALVALALDFPNATDLTVLRHRFLAELLEVEPDELPIASDTTFPTAAGLTATFQLQPRGLDDLIVLVALTSTASYPANVAAQDVTSGTALAAYSAELQRFCVRDIADRRVDFVWAIDVSGSMAEEQDAIARLAEDFVTILESNDIDYRLAVTSADCTYIANDPEVSPLARSFLEQTLTGCSAVVEPRPPTPEDNGALCSPGFTSDPREFRACIRTVGGTFGLEYTFSMGAVALDRAIPRVLGDPLRIRAGADAVLIVVTDERDQSFEDQFDWVIDESPVARPETLEQADELMAFVQRWAGFLDRPALRASVHGILWIPGTDCPTGFEEALATDAIIRELGGTVASICDEDLAPALEAIAQVSSGLPDTVPLSHTPIATSLNVIITTDAGEETVIRSTESGFDYDPIRRRVSFSPRLEDALDVQVAYYIWVNSIFRCAENTDCPAKLVCSASRCEP